MKRQILIDFDTTSEQQLYIKQLINDEIINSYLLCVHSIVDYNLYLTLEMQVNNPVIRLGLYSMRQNNFVNKQLDNETLYKALRDLFKNYQLALTNKPPVAHVRLVKLWSTYTGSPITVIDLD